MTEIVQPVGPGNDNLTFVMEQLKELDNSAVPVSSAPVSSAPVSSAPVSSAPVSETVISTSIINHAVHSELSAPKNLQVQTEHLIKVVDSIIDLVDGHKFTPAMIIRIVANCMRLTASMKVSPAAEKLIITEAIEKYIRERAGLSEEEVDVVMIIVDATVNEAIDTLADVRSGAVKLSDKGCCVIL